MTYSRAEAQALTRPIRENILAVSNYLQVVHGVRADNREKTNPGLMDLVPLRRWTVYYGLELRDADGELFSEDDLRANAAERQLNPPGHESDANLDKLQSTYDRLKARRQAILDDLDDDADNVATGPAQTVVPESLSVDVLTGMVDEG